VVLSAGIATGMLLGGDDQDSNMKVVITYDPPSPEECAAIANGTVVDGQEDATVQSFDIHIQVTLAYEADMAVLLTEMTQQIQETLLPLLVGCDDDAPTTNVIANGGVNAKQNEAQSCSDGAAGPCHSVIVTMDLYLKGEESSETLKETISNVFAGDHLINNLRSSSPVEQIDFIEVVQSEPSTDEPTLGPSPSIVNANPTNPPNALQVDVPTPNPTRSPINYPIPVETPAPTTRRPATAPTPAPAIVPTPPPTSPPTPGPTKAPTLPPTPAPTKSPTKLPSSAPTSTPVISPTPPPTPAPTPDPTKEPTPLPTPEPTPSPTPEPTPQPTPSPTAAPSTRESLCLLLPLLPVCI
jgi:hypothetical protein